MEPSCLGFLRSLLCCQDEFDDTVHVDFTAIKNAFKKKRPSLSESEYRTYLLGHSPIPTSVPRRIEATRDLDIESSAALLQRARALWLSSRSSPQPSSSSSSSKPPIVNCPSPIAPKPAIVFVSSSSPIASKDVIVSSSSPITLKPAIVSSSSLLAPKTAIVSSSSPIAPKHAIVSSSSLVAPKPWNGSYMSPIGLKPAIVNSPSTIASKSAIVRSPSPIASNPGIASSSSPIAPKFAIVSSSSLVAPKPGNGSYLSPIGLKPAIVNSNSTIASKSAIVRSPSPIASKPGIASSSSSRFSYAEPEASSREKARVKKAKHAKVDKNGVPLYLVPDHIKDLIDRDVVPRVLTSPVCPSSYKEYFSTLLYAEDYYCEKWDDYELKNVTLELHEASRYKKSGKQKRVFENEDQIFVAFKIDSIPEKRPYLLSRDRVLARPSGSKIKPFQGEINRVVKSNVILVKFEDDFHSQHYPSHTYDISFWFNRVCLKRAHEALNSISNTFYENFLFPNAVPRNSKETRSTVQRILNIKSPPPYLISGPKCASERKSAAYQCELSKTGLLVQEAVVEIYRANPGRCRILICSPSNSSCDFLMRGLKRKISESEMFRANAAFREKEDVPEDILSSSLYRVREECFACPHLEALRSYKIIFCTFMSTYRLHREGLPVGHFSHIFMVDSSTAIEPEALVPLANFADENTVVVVAGEPGLSPNRSRSKIARENGLRVSYFERLRKCRPYRSLDTGVVTQLDLNRDTGYY